MKSLGGKGNILLSNGPVGQEDARLDLEQQQAAVKACPNAKVVGIIPGDWTSPGAKTGAIEWLAAHPGVTVNGVMTNAGEATGYIEGFEQAGKKPLPVVTFVGGSSVGMLAWWGRTPSYPTLGDITNGSDVAWGSWGILTRILAGKGLKVNSIAAPPILVTQSNLSQYNKSPNAPLADSSAPPAPVGAWIPDAYLDNFFAKPGTPGR
jgi:ABC-type sugar transport system substrate-binding protein